MNAIFSIDKNYSDLIFTGEKDIEFRKIKTRLKSGDKVYVYETKKNGCGKVVGYFIIDRVWEVPKVKIATYNFIYHYASKFSNKETLDMVKKALSIELKEYNNCLVLNYLFDDEALNFMLSNGRPYDSNELLLRHISKMTELSKINDIRWKFLDDVDGYLYKMGAYDGDEFNYNYAYFIKDFYKFDIPVDISFFKNLEGKEILKAPQSFCYTVTNI